jgi:NAD(P)-dependent dehydrogenase (short-subunit alcohol dehydrogenase family)
MTREEDWTNAVAEADRLGGADILVNNAGMVIYGGAEKITPEEFGASST